MLYAVVHKSRVVAGPMAWNQKFFTTVLKLRHRIEANIPGRPPTGMPWVIDDQTSVHEVEEIRPPMDALTEFLQGPTWDFSQPVIVGTYEAVPQPMESARNNFRAIAMEERYRRETGGVKVTIQGRELTADTSREGRHIFIQKFLLMREIDTVNWKFPEGWITLTKAELGAVVQAGASHIQASFDWEKQINSQIDAAQNGAELYAIEIVPPRENDRMTLGSPE
jgi:hypothetical protein